MRKRRSYTKAFKAEAVRLLGQSGKPAAELARELGIRRNQLYKWCEQITAHGEQAFPGSGRPPEPSNEAARLRRDLARVTEERDILKKAVAFFTKGSA
ncbi:MAG: transposase [Nitrospirae bacterium]|nr:transposase [Nitrospirota bacterium]